MAKDRSKQFTISEQYQLGLVDRWWAGLLHTGMREMVEVRWEALGEMQWRLLIVWRNVSGDRLNVGHPRYADISADQLDESLQDSLGEFEATHHDYEILRKKAEDWGLEAVRDEDGCARLQFNDSLDDAERIMALEFVWPSLRELERNLAFLTTQMTEIDREMRARKEPDYFSISIDRGMLRAAFLEQVGYDNEWLFLDMTDPQPHREE